MIVSQQICIGNTGTHGFTRIIETNATIITIAPITETGPISLINKKKLCGAPVFVSNRNRSKSLNLSGRSHI